MEDVKPLRLNDLEHAERHDMSSEELGGPALFRRTPAKTGIGLQNGSRTHRRGARSVHAFQTDDIKRVTGLPSIEELELSPSDLPTFQQFFPRTHGIILVTGPTGSGKTTTHGCYRSRAAQKLRDHYPADITCRGELLASRTPRHANARFLISNSRKGGLVS